MKNLKEFGFVLSRQELREILGGAKLKKNPCDGVPWGGCEGDWDCPNRNWQGTILSYGTCGDCGSCR